MKAHNVDIRDSLDGSEQCAKTAGREQKRVTAGQDDFAHGRYVSQVGERLCQRGIAEQTAARADMFAAESEAAIDGADQERLEQGAVGIALEDAGNR